MTTLLEVTDLDAYYGPIQALRGVSLTIRDGEMVALLGPNGAGKTTTLRAISGLIPSSRGAINFAGADIRGMRPNKIVRRGLAHLPEGRELFTGLTVEENIRAGFWTQRRTGGDYERRCAEVMDMFPILRERSDQKAGTLSGGEQQMLSVARALMSSPRLLIIDELSLGLAPKIVEQLFDILRAVNKTGTALLIVEQFVHMALANTDRAYVLGKGELVLQEASRNLLENEALVAAYLGNSSTAAAEPTRRRRSAAGRRSNASPN